MDDVPLPIELPTVQGDAFPLALYDAMCRAIDVAHAVDEAKDIRDKALAFEVYARQAKNIDAERRAVDIRLRAERKAGSLLAESEKARPPGSNQHQLRSSRPTDPPTLRDLGVSKQQSSDWQRLADIPKDEFEEALADRSRKPTTAGLIREHTPPEPERVPVAAAALWLWGRLNDFERDGLLTARPADVLLTMTPSMLDEVHRLAPRVAAWLKQIGALDA